MRNDCRDCKTSEILVSVWMPVYYAGDQLRRSLDSILMQETDYLYEIVINDDCSGDNSWDVISEYAEKYPDLIRAQRNEKNMGLSPNVLATKKRCRGKYLVNLSGGDYWIDPKKLQKQVDFLEAHPEYIGVGSKVEIRYEDSEVAHSSYPAEAALGCDFTLESYNRGVNLPSHGFLMRNIFLDPEKSQTIDRVYGVSSAIDDLFDPVLYLQFGKIHIMQEATCVYTVVRKKQGRHNFNSLRKPLEKSLMVLDGYVKLDSLAIEGVDLSSRLTGAFKLVVLGGISNRNLSVILKAYQSIPERYKKPWYKSVGMKCVLGIWRTGFVILRKKILKVLPTKK